MPAKWSAVVTLLAQDKASQTIAAAVRRIQAGLGGIQSLGARVEKTFLWAGAAAAGGVASIGYAIQGWAKGTDELSKFARQVGLSVSVLDALGYVADRQGVAVDDLHRGLRFFSRTLGRLQRGGGEAATSLRRLDPVLLQQLRRAKSVEEALTAVWQAFERARTPALRAAIATAVFGRSGQDMVRMVDGGVGALEELMARARRLGVVTQEQGAEAEAWQDALSDLQRAFHGLRGTLAVEVLPVVRGYVVQMAEWIAAHRGLLAQKVHEFVARIVAYVRLAFAWWERNKESIVGVMRAIESYGGRVLAVLGGWKNVILGLVGIVAAGRLVGFVNSLVAAFGGLWRGIAGVIGVFRGFVALCGRTVSVLSGATGTVTVFGASLGSIVTYAGAATAALGSMVTAVITWKEAIEEAVSLAEYKKMVEETREAVEAYRVRKEREREQERVRLTLEAANLGLPEAVAHLPLRELREVVQARREGRAVEVGGKILIEVRGGDVKTVDIQQQSGIELEVGVTGVGRGGW